MKNGGGDGGRGHTLIVGGGLAGLAAAAALAQRGVPVTLMESRPRLGGRAGSFLDKTTGEWIDNCQHVSLGCCTNFQHFCESIGVSHLLRRERRLNFIGPDGRVHPLKAGLWPAPLHLWPAFRRLGYLSRADRRQIRHGLRALARHMAQGPGTPSVPGPFKQWLQEHGQSQTAIERFWHVVLVSALSETLDRIDVACARKVFVDAFLAHRRGWEVNIPTAPLEALYGTTLIEWLKRHGVDVRLQTGVQRLCVQENRAVAVELRDGTRHAADQLILAVPHHRVLSLLPESLQSDPQLAGIAKLESAPISSVHLWFDRPITPLPHAVFVERLSQWMFNRTQLQATAGSPLSALRSPLSYYQIVISASRNVTGRPQQEVIDEVVRELTDVWPEAGGAKLVHSRLVTEHRAVFSVQPGTERFRPTQQSPIHNLQLAGDWTQTGWPPTMEGAVRSGYLAAENVLRQLGRPEQLIQPDLPVGMLSKYLLGL